MRMMERGVVAQRVPRPPQYFANTIVSRVFRFQRSFTAGFTSPDVTTLTASKLCALQVIGTVVNTTAVQLYESVRIRKIEMWISPPSTGNIVTGSIMFPGTAAGIQGPNRERSDQTIGMTVPAYISLSPGKNSQAADWQPGATNTGTNTFFLITVGSVDAASTFTVTIDVHLALRMTSDARTTNNSVTLGTVALGAFYNLALDNPAGATGSVGNLWIPDRSLVTTT